jgi:hypothetical protein
LSTNRCRDPEPPDADPLRLEGEQAVRVLAGLDLEVAQHPRRHPPAHAAPAGPPPTTIVSTETMRAF